MRPDWPRLFVIGAPKCGTTSVFDLLCQIEGLVPSAIKEPNFFEYEKNYQRGLDSYLSLFPESTHDPESMRFEATPWYLYSKIAAERIYKEIGGNCRFIICTRDPVDRAISHYRDFFGGGRETRDFRTAFKQEIQKMVNQGPIFEGRFTSYMSASFVSIAAKPWIEIFGRNSLFFVDFEKVRSDPVGLSHEFSDWLGKSPPDPARIQVPRNKNEASGVRLKTLNKAPAAILRTSAGTMVRRALPWSAYARAGELWRTGMRSSTRAVSVHENDIAWLRECGDKLFKDETDRLQKMVLS